MNKTIMFLCTLISGMILFGGVASAIPPIGCMPYTPNVLKCWNNGSIENTTYINRSLVEVPYQTSNDDMLVSMDYDNPTAEYDDLYGRGNSYAWSMKSKVISVNERVECNFLCWITKLFSKRQK